MQKAESIIRAMQKLGDQRATLTRVYRNLYCEELYLLAYGKLYQNKGAMTAGVTEETVDGMSRERISQIIIKMRQESYQFAPLRRSYIEKRDGGKRPLGIPTFSDKLVQEVVRRLLEAYYEPQFSEHSHGFRPDRGCHTALAHIKKKFTGTVWYIEGDIRGCFDNIDHERLLTFLQADIQDGRFVNLIRRMLKAGYLEDWRYDKSYSGTPQGGVISPILANIYLHRLDMYYEQVLRPKYNDGRAKQISKEYWKIEGRMRRAYRSGDKEKAAKWRKQLRRIPTQEADDPTFRRLKYVRYADDFLLGFVGTKVEAEQIRNELRGFLAQELKLELSEEKTHITHARTGNARFLGYNVSTYQEDSKLSYNVKGYKVRSINGQQRLSVPPERVEAYCREYMQGDKPVSQAAMTFNSVAEIINAYQSKYRGIAEYYKYASNRADLGKLKNVMQVSLVKTLAHKLKIPVSQIYSKYQTTKVVDGRKYKVLKATVETEDRVYEFVWGGISLAVQPIGTQFISDQPPRPIHLARNDLVRRLQADRCEQCGATEQIEVHHVRKLKDLQKQWQGRKEKPKWVEFMIGRRRKTIILCQSCHDKLHQGKLD
jgi:group II intron reverse transcriptase/maturase